MNPSKNTNKRLARFLNIQKKTAKYYREIAFITSDESVATLAKKFAKNHDQMFAQTADFFKVDLRQLKFFQWSKCYLQKIWLKAKKALILNNSRQIIEYIWQAECKFLQYLQPMLQNKNVDSNRQKMLSDYQQKINLHLRQINEL